MPTSCSASSSGWTRRSPRSPAASAVGSGSARSPPGSSASSSPRSGCCASRRRGSSSPSQDLESPEVFRLLARGELELAISMESDSAPRHDDERFTRTPLMRDLLDVALPHDHRLARESAVPLAALASEPFVAPPRGWSCEDVIRVGCAAAGFSPAVAHRSADWTAVMALVGAGLGVACVPRLAQDEPPPGVAIRPIAGERALPAPVHRVPARGRGTPRAAGGDRGVAGGGVAADRGASCKRSPGRSARVHAVTFLHASRVGLPARCRSSRGAFCLLNSFPPAPVVTKGP